MTGVANNTDWTECKITVPKEYYSHDTENSMCFVLWGKKRMNFPRTNWCKMEFDGEQYFFTIPKWFVEKHGLKYMMEKEVRELLFPLKGKKKKSTPLFDAIPAAPEPEEIVSTVFTPKEEKPEWW